MMAVNEANSLTTTAARVKAQSNKSNGAQVTGSREIVLYFSHNITACSST